MFLFDNQLITGDNNSCTLLTLKGVITPATERLNRLVKGEGKMGSRGGKFYVKKKKNENERSRK